MKKIFFLILLFVSSLSFGQNYQKIDSLKQLLDLRLTESERVDVLNDIFFSFLYYDNDSAGHYAKVTFELSNSYEDSL